MSEFENFSKGSLEVMIILPCWGLIIGGGDTPLVVNNLDCGKMTILLGWNLIRVIRRQTITWFKITLIFYRGLLFLFFSRQTVTIFYGTCMD